MTTPRLEIDLEKVRHNASALVDLLAARRISVMGVTKATLGSPAIATTLLRAGVTSLGDARIENIEAMRHAGVRAFMALIRSPMLSQVERVVAHADLSLNTEIEVIRALSREAQRVGTTHDVVLMVELGDLREGIMPADLEGVVRQVLRLPSIAFRGIGTNLACRSGTSPDARNMAELSQLASSLEATFGVAMDVVSGGSSANLDWAFRDSGRGRVNELRLGESILLGRETLHRRPIEGLHTDAFTLVAEVIESKRKPSQPWGEIAEAAFGMQPPAVDRGDISQVILAVGRQDVDASGLSAPHGFEIVSASSDHLVVNTGPYRLAVGAEVRFQLNYSALLSAMTSPFVEKVMLAEEGRTPAASGHTSR